MLFYYIGDSNPEVYHKIEIDRELLDLKDKRNKLSTYNTLQHIEAVQRGKSSKDNFIVTELLIEDHKIPYKEIIDRAPPDWEIIKLCNDDFSIYENYPHISFVSPKDLRGHEIYIVNGNIDISKLKYGDINILKNVENWIFKKYKVYVFTYPIIITESNRDKIIEFQELYKLNFEKLKIRNFKYFMLNNQKIYYYENELGIIINGYLHKKKNNKYVYHGKCVVFRKDKN